MFVLKLFDPLGLFLDRDSLPVPVKEYINWNLKMRSYTLLNIIWFVAMTSSYPKKLNGLCIGVLSGDRVLFQGPADKENGGYKQKILHLTSISAPKIDLSTGNEEKFAYASREFLRKRLVGTNTFI